MAGSSLFYCSLFDLMDHGHLVSVDIKALHNLQHPRATFLHGGSTSPEVIAQIEQAVNGISGPVMVILDSDHSRDHVRLELDLYTSFVTVGSYCLVQDGVIDQMSFYRNARPGPLPAIREFLAANTHFRVDEGKCRTFPITHHPLGWLKRTR